MCAVSNIGDKWSQRNYWPNWPDDRGLEFPSKERNPGIKFVPPSIPSYPFTPPKSVNPLEYVTLEEFVVLKKQVEEMRRQLMEAKKKDIAEGNPDCEMEEKVVILKKIAKVFDIDLSEVFVG